MGKNPKINSSTNCNKDEPVGKNPKINSRTGFLLNKYKNRWEKYLKLIVVPVVIRKNRWENFQKLIVEPGSCIQQRRVVHSNPMKTDISH